MALETGSVMLPEYQDCCSRDNICLIRAERKLMVASRRRICLDIPEEGQVEIDSVRP